ncbi:hypothetical protein TCAL_04900 [Tigriopus californicus]|uniref:FAM86 N-terminal domain-containing protein n=1 Tax=Tigriopus californicus TaxID=6832 RepID=A0A553NEI3_TIGCA|nr:protein-lysine N-methyltransferase EEF2KMT-like [Tigriopus californicus]TRY63825.1 hypothetical protein TCAL_04900 [Tigriopus californicus]
MEKTQKLKSTFSHYYFAHLHTVFQQWTDLSDEIIGYAGTGGPALGIQLQQDLLSEIIVNHTSSKFPVSKVHQRRVAQWLSDLCQELNWTLLPEFQTWMDRDPHLREPDHIFKTYEYSNDSGVRVVLLEENRDPLGQGTTGLISWQGACMLGAWFETFGDQLEGKRILELGSGLGLFGMSLLKQRHVKSYYFTDCHPKVLSFLQLNYELNFTDKGMIGQNDLDQWIETPPQIMPGTSKADSSCVHIQKLDWTDFNIQDMPEVDVILGSDLVYSVELLPNLAKVIRMALSKSSDEHSKAIISCTQRNHDHLEQFLNCLRKEALDYCVLTRRTFNPNENMLIHHEPFKPIILYEIKLDQHAK